MSDYHNSAKEVIQAMQTLIDMQSKEIATMRRNFNRIFKDLDRYLELDAFGHDARKAKKILTAKIKRYQRTMGSEKTNAKRKLAVIERRDAIIRYLTSNPIKTNGRSLALHIRRALGLRDKKGNLISEKTIQNDLKTEAIKNIWKDAKRVS